MIAALYARKSTDQDNSEKPKALDNLNRFAVSLSYDTDHSPRPR
jgi:hypothetical protein